jgi:hypothetical protein
VADRRTPDETLIEAVRILSRTIQTEDGVIPACLAEVATRLAELVEERRCVWTDYDGSRDFDTACGEKHSIQPGFELYDYCPFCGCLVEQHDACEQEEDKPLPPGPEGEA